MTRPAPSWTTGTVPNSFAAAPAGRVGTLGGRLMSLLNAAQQREVAALVVGAPREVVEVGHGPGVLLAELARRPGIVRVHGVDPSREMRRLAVRRLAGPIADGVLEIHPGHAAATGLPDASVDLAVSVNTVAIWPDLDGGVAELHRVLRPGGELLLSWHGGRAPGRAHRRLALPDELLARIDAAVTARFGAVRRDLTRHCTVFRATR